MKHKYFNNNFFCLVIVMFLVSVCVIPVMSEVVVLYTKLWTPRMQCNESSDLRTII